MIKCIRLFISNIIVFIRIHKVLSKNNCFLFALHAICLFKKFEIYVFVFLLFNMFLLNNIE